MTLTAAFLEGRHGFDAVDRYLLRAVGDRAAGRLPGPLPADWDAVRRRAEHRNVTHLLHDVPPGVFPEKATTQLAAASAFASAIQERHRADWDNIRSAFAARGIPVTGFKGLFLNALLSRPASQVPIMSDLDLVVAHQDVDRGARVLHELGYVTGLGIKNQSFYRMNSAATAEFESEDGAYGQLAPMSKPADLTELTHLADELAAWYPQRNLVRTAAGPRSLTSVDLHWDVGHTEPGAARPVPGLALLERSVSSRYLGSMADSPDLATMTWLMAYRAHLDIVVLGERRFKLLADIALALHHGGWRPGVAEELFDAYPFTREPVSHTLEFLRVECGVPLPGADPRLSRSGASPRPVPAVTPGVRGTLIVCHGWGTARGTSPLVRRLRDRAAARNVQVVELAPFTETAPVPVGRAAHRLTGLVEAVRTEAGPEHLVGLLGVSLGSAAAVRAALDVPLDFLVTVGTCVSTRVNMPDHPEKLLARPTGRQGGEEALPFLTGHVDRAFLRDLVQGVPLARLHELRVPTLVLDGGQDAPWRREDAALLHDGTALTCPGSRHQVFPAAGHTLDDAPVGATAAILSWVDTLYPSGSPAHA